MQYQRLIEPNVREALADTPVVVLSGPRQSGKTTLARRLAGTSLQYITLDDATSLDAARRDPVGFVRELDRAVIDEVQRAPDLLLAIKRSVDEDRRPGRFLLTGSANLLTAPRIKESLAGRSEILPLYPLSHVEIRRRKKAAFLASVFAGKIPKPSEGPLGRALLSAVLAGGYPEALSRAAEPRRLAWYRAYVDAIIERDLPELAQVDRPSELPKFVRLLAEHSAQLVNLSSIGGQIGLDHTTVGRYIGLFEALFLVSRLPPWFRSNLKRLVKTPKLHFIDSGLLSALRGQTASRIQQQRAGFGPMLESFVYSELLKQASWAGERLSFFHYRDKDQLEVDIVVENDRGEVLGVEVKTAASVQNADFRGLRRLADFTGSAFKQGIVLYDGEDVVRFGDKLAAVPFSCLWS